MRVSFIDFYCTLARFYASEAPASSDALRLTFAVPHKVIWTYRQLIHKSFLFIDYNLEHLQGRYCSTS